MRSLSAAPEAVDVDRHLELGATRTSARAEHVHLVLQAAAATGDAGGQDPAGAAHGRPREEAVQQGRVHRRAGGVAAHHVAPHVPTPVGVQADHPVGRARAPDLLTAPVEAADVELRGGAKRDAGAGTRRGAPDAPELGVDAQAEGAVAGRPTTAARGARVLGAGTPDVAGAGLSARDRSPAGAGEGAGPGLAVGAGARRGATRGREDARAPLATAAHPRTYRRDPTGAALVGAVLADAILAGTAARARSAGGRDARGDAPLAHDRAGDGAARAGRGAGVAGAGAGGRRGRTGETIAVAHPVTVTLPPSGLAVGAHATRRGVGDGTRHAPPVGPAVSPRAARRAPHKVDARGDQDLTRGARAAEGLSHPPVGGARGTDRDHPRRGGGRRHARVLRPRRELRVGDAGAGGQLAARQAAQAGGEAVLTHLGAARRPNRGRPNDTLVAGPGVGDNHRGVAAAREGDGGHREQEGGHDRGEHPRGRNDLLHDNTPWGYEPREK